LPPGLPLSGVVLSDHLKNCDWSARKIVFIAKAPADIVELTRAKIKPLLQS
jgi:hypothetical protein